MRCPNGVEPLLGDERDLVILAYDFLDLDIDTEVGNALPAQAIEVASLIGGAGTVGLGVPANDIVALEVEVVGIALTLVVIGNQLVLAASPTISAAPPVAPSALNLRKV